LANARLGTHSTKGRSEVSGGGRKPWKQKGTGRARQGSTRAAQWVGGGKVHTPKPRDYSKDMPKKMRRAALRSALTVKAQDEAIIMVDGLNLGDAKTKAVAESLNKLAGEETVLVVLAEKGEHEESFARAARNLPSTKTILARYLNIRDLLGYDKVVLPVNVLPVIEGFLGKGK
jgi:large subunit ribosomal protein L4